ncbi:hypothetical protein [Paracoccus laeviglucosivorans]|nr:hypothetical protein [Paracoccus laeviglucosivorans]
MGLKQELFTIEQGFWLSGKEHFSAHLDAHCVLAFPQAGEMHGVQTREDVARTATSENRWKDLRMTDRSVLQPSPDVAIISYRADVNRADGQPYSALIGSAYIRRDEGWKLAFHQHSPL